VGRQWDGRLGPVDMLFAVHVAMCDNTLCVCFVLFVLHPVLFEFEK